MKNNKVKICRQCGKEICIIPQRMYRSVIVDAEAVEVVADRLGDEFIRFDGTKVKAREIKPDEIVKGAEFAYRPHRKACGSGHEV